MTPEMLRTLVARGETLAVEFKGEQAASLNDRELVEAAVCLANRAEIGSAWLLVGIEDDGGITGARPRHGSTTNTDRVAALIASRTRPPLAVHAEVVPVDCGSVLVIEIPAARQTVGTSDGVFVRRTFGGDGRPACVPMDGTEEAASLTQRPDAEARGTLHRLVEAGLVEERGRNRGRSWHLSAAAYRALGDKAGYVRQRGFEPLQQEQMVLQYVEKHGRVTRRETAELCRISSDQSKRLLDRLVRTGRLARCGRHRRTWYERGPQIWRRP